MSVHIGIDLGGTKLLVAAIDHEGQNLFSLERPTPRDDYEATLDLISELISEIELQIGCKMPVGIGMPGSLSLKTGVVQNANSTWLNGRAFDVDISQKLGRHVRLANDANCFTLSEAVDGAAAGTATVFGVIMGTGVGGGIVINGALLNGPRSIGGEWGHWSLPFPTTAELLRAHHCWCGQKGCLESWISGPALVAHFNAGPLTAGEHDHQGTGPVTRVEEIIAAADDGDQWAENCLLAHASQTARGLAQVVNLIDPDVIVLGGGLSGMASLYERLPDLMAPYIFSDDKRVDIRPPRFGATSGVRGAARLWPYPEEQF